MGEGQIEFGDVKLLQDCVQRTSDARYEMSAKANQVLVPSSSVSTIRAHIRRTWLVVWATTDEISE